MKIDGFTKVLLNEFKNNTFLMAEMPLNVYAQLSFQQYCS